MQNQESTTSTSSDTNLRGQNKWIKPEKEQAKVYLNDNESIDIEFENTEDDKRKFFETLKDVNPIDYDYTSDASSDEGVSTQDWLRPTGIQDESTTSSKNMKTPSDIKNLDDGESFGYSLNASETKSSIHEPIKHNIMARQHEISMEKRSTKPPIPHTVDVGTETDYRPILTAKTPFVDTSSSNNSSRILLTSAYRPRKPSKPKVGSILEQSSFEQDADISLSLQLESEADKLSKELKESQKRVESLELQLVTSSAVIKEKDQELEGIINSNGCLGDTKCHSIKRFRTRFNKTNFG